MSSSQLSSIQKPILSLDLDLTENGERRQCDLELSKDELAELVSSLEAANKVRGCTSLEFRSNRVYVCVWFRWWASWGHDSESLICCLFMCEYLICDIVAVPTHSKLWTAHQHFMSNNFYCCLLLFLFFCFWFCFVLGGVGLLLFFGFGLFLFFLFINNWFSTGAQSNIWISASIINYLHILRKSVALRFHCR